jgi:nitrite reductase/ring-hydroxylating ferredoxin subunit
MDGTNALVAITDQPALDAVAKPLSQAIRNGYRAAGAAGQRAKNAAHGVWLGHPLHPVFTDLPLGAWTTGLVLDAVASRNRDRGMERAADVAIAVGLAGAAAAAVTGLTDWSETDGRARRTGLVHGLLNIAATTLYAASYVLRKSGSRSSGQTCAVAGYGIAVGAAWFGGDLVYDQRIGVNHAAAEQPESFTPVIASADVPEGSMKRAHTTDADALVARQHGRLCALAHSCSHLGGPLSEGTLKDGSVVCPWHGSEFALADGHVINGPATQTQPVLDAREQGAQIAVKARPS